MTSHPANLPRVASRPRVFLLGVVGLLISAHLSADGRIDGVVLDKNTQAALPGADISVVGTQLKAVSGKDGSYRLRVPAGTHQVVIDYLGYDVQTITVEVKDDAVASPKTLLNTGDIVVMDAFEVTGMREGQARANNQQRTSQTLTTIISADLAGQFPDKTIADAVKRLPGITVETDTDTGGSEGRYVTIRGMNADFNAVTVNGMRVAVSDFGGLSRRVPLDVVSAKSADQIEVTKAVRPDQDGDAIGGAVNISTRSPFDRSGAYAFAEGALLYSSALRDYTGNYPFDNPGREASAGYANTFGSEKTWGFAVSANTRARTSTKQRVSTQGWAANGGPGGAYYPIGVGYQDFFDDIDSTGANGTLEWRPDAETKLRFDVSYSDRETQRGRQRLVNGFLDGGSGSADGDTYSSYTSSGRLVRNVRQFFEAQKILAWNLRGEKLLGPWTLESSIGHNAGSFNGDANRDLNATFRTSSVTKTFTAGGYFPTLTGDTYLSRVNDPSRYFFNALDRGTSFVDDREWAASFDAKRDLDLGGARGSVKAGVKARLFERDYDRRARRVRFISSSANNWALNGFSGQSQVGSAVAEYRDPKIVKDRYDLGFYINPDLVRSYADHLQRASAQSGAGLLEDFPDNANRSRAGSYEVQEDIYAGYLMTEQTWDKLTVLAGARIEATELRFKGASAVTNPSNGQYVTVTPYDRSRDYVSVLPGMHFRYNARKNLVYRFSVNRSIARPQLSSLNPSTIEDAFGEDALSRPGDFIATVDRGTLSLKPTESTNVDLGLEYYWSTGSSLTAELFLKDMKNNVYRGYNFNDPSYPGYLVRTSLNAPSSWVRGFSVGYNHELKMLPSPLDGLNVFFNYTYADSKVDVGQPQFAGTRLPLFDQVKHTLNAGIGYDKGRITTRLSLLHRSESLIGLSIDEDFRDYDTKLSRYQAPSTSLDFTFTFKFTVNLQAFVQAQNILNAPGRAYNVEEKRFDYNEYSGWLGTVGVRWSL
ncbi:MAG: TonB-dependent receptor [Opitutaceae bacterium]|nr:TonB-dependent receptor [Opitutaceae bacterium]